MTEAFVFLIIAAAAACPFAILYAVHYYRMFKLYQEDRNYWKDLAEKRNAE